MNGELLNTPDLRDARDFRSFLQMELLKRCKRNPAYSLRSFAQTLGIHHAQLSLLLRGKRTFSMRRIRTLGLKLGLNPADIDAFQRGTTLGPRSAVPDSATSAPATDFRQLTADAFEAISEWYHDAILELATMPRFSLTAEAAARALGIRVVEAQGAIDRLSRLGFLHEDPQGRLRPTNPATSTNLDDSVTSAALRNYQRKLLEMAQAALDDESREFRDHTSLMLPIARKDIPEVKLRIRRFREELSQFLMRDPEALEQVYQVCVSFFPLSEKIEQVTKPRSLPKKGNHP